MGGKGRMHGIEKKITKKRGGELRIYGVVSKEIAGEV